MERLLDENDAQTGKFIDRMSDSMEIIEKLAAQQKEGQAAVRYWSGNADKQKEAGEYVSMEADEKAVADVDESGSLGLGPGL